MLNDSRAAPASHLDASDGRPVRKQPDSSLGTDVVVRLPLLARRPHSPAVRVALTLLAVVTAMAATALVRTPSGFGTFVFSILGVVVAAWLGGMAHALPATIALALLADYLWMEPRFSLRIVRPGEAVTLIAFVTVALLIGALVDALRRLEARWRAQAMELSVSYQRQTTLTAEAERAKADAESASGAKTQFLTLMSHELRTPLNAILGYEQLLHDGITGPVTEEQRTQLRRIKANAAHLLELISEILTLSKIEAGKERITTEPVDLTDMVEEVASQTRSLAARKPIEVRVGPCERGLTVLTDRLKVKQILLNLASNAVKFTDRGVVELRTERGEEDVLIRVRDTGIGISRQDVECIWDAFWQVDQTHAHRAQGTGLGLSVSRHLARLLGGDVTVESEPGRGSKFTLHLPASVPVQSAEALHAESASAESTGTRTV